MMKKYFYFIIVLVIIFSSLINAQTEFGISAGGGYISGSLYGVRLPYWENGYLLNLSVEKYLSNNLSIFLNGSYQSFNFNPNLVHFVLPDIVDINFTVSGKKSNVYEISTGGNFYLSSNNIKPFLSIGGGILKIQQGKIIETGSYQEKTNSIYSSVLAGSNQNYLIGQFSFGFGIKMLVYKNIGVIVEGKLVSSFSQSSSQYIPIFVSASYGF
jgi:hypothetical protein